MTKPTKLKMSVDCDSCPMRTEDHFCGLEQTEMLKFSSLKSRQRYPRGKTIFFEGEPAGGVYILCAGRVKLSTNSEEGKSIIVRIVEPGEVLALSATVNSSPLEGSARAIDECLISFVDKRDFTHLLNSSRPVALKAIGELGRVYRKAYTRICTLGLSSSVSERLARLFLEWCDRSCAESVSASIPLTYTHEEIAEMIGTSRETVTRLLGTFREQCLIDLHGHMLYIPDTRRLRGLVGSGKGRNGKASGSRANVQSVSQATV